MLKVVKWTAIVAGIIAIPCLLKLRADDTKKKRVNILYDTNDYISESGL